jgi:hypothetical protein
MKVVRAHQRRRNVTIEDTRRAVQEAALRTSQGVAGPETQELVAKLEKATRCDIAALAVHAEQWPASLLAPRSYMATGISSRRDV